MSERIDTTVGKNHDRKEGSRQPEYRGKVVKCPYCDNGPIYLSYWIKTNRETGEKFFGGEAQKPQEGKPKDEPPPFDDSLPF